MAGPFEDRGGIQRLLGAHTPRRRAAGYAIAGLGTVVLTASLLPFRSDLTPLSKGFGYLIVVIAAAWVGGFGPGIAASLGGFVTFNFFFLPPYDTFVIGRPEYVGVLFVFLGVSVLISTLLARAVDRADAAERREAELRALFELTSQQVAQVPGPAAREAALRSVVELFGFDAGALFVQDAREYVGLHGDVVVGAAPGEIPASWDPRNPGRPPERLPLTVGGRAIGLIVLRGARPALSPEESRVLRTFCDELALVLERDRLLKSATDAELYRRSDDMRRSLLAAVSHDLRTPLATIVTTVTDLLAEDSPHDGAYVREALAGIRAESGRLETLISNLLDMSRIEAGLLKSHAELVDLWEVLTAAADRVQRQFPGVRVDIDVAPGAEDVRADPVFLERVVSNLLENAAKSTRAAGDGVVSVGVVAEGHTAVVRVVDHGLGVPAEMREQLFHPFYRLEQRGPNLGTGLGLAISKGFLDLMDGDIWLEETPAGGATFAFTLPIDARVRT
jgi:two-component system, OmpR family, sensor histidine kinase KdpD